MISRIRFTDVFLLFAGGATIAGVAAFTAALLEASPSLIYMWTAVVSSLSWIFGYEAMSRSRGWIALRVRLAATGWKSIAAGIAPAFALVVLISILAQSLRWLGLRVDDAPAGPFLSSRHEFLLGTLICVGVIGPLAEELVFRGLLLDWLRQKMTVWPAILGDACIFALLHNNALRSGATGWLQLASRLLLGIATAYFALRYRSLRTSFAMHATNNCIAILAAST